MKEPILYLDFDGVLHRQLTMQQVRRGQSVVLFEFAERLERLLSPYPDVRIVLSTSWVVSHGLQGSLDALRQPALCTRVIGATYDPATTTLSAFGGRPRWQQIVDDVERRNPSAWVALDDEVNQVPVRYNNRFILVPSKCGLGCAAAVDRLEEMLAYWFGQSSGA